MYIPASRASWPSGNDRTISGQSSPAWLLNLCVVLGATAALSLGWILIHLFCKTIRQWNARSLIWLDDGFVSEGGIVV
jgi:hypothetical protein